MKINPKVLAQLAPTYDVHPMDAMKGAKQVIASGQTLKAPAGYEPILIGNGYEWNEEQSCYIMGDQTIYYLPNKLFMWCWQNSLIRLFNSASKLQKWVQGDDKYLEGKANSFMGIYKEMTGQDDSGGGTAVAPPDEKHNQDEPIPMDRAFADEPTNPVFKGKGSRGENVPEPESADPSDVLIAQAKKKMGKAGTLTHDEIIDLYNKSKELKSNKLMAFIKTIKPLGEGFIKKSTLDEIVRQIVKTIVQEANDENNFGYNNWESDPALQLARQLWGSDWIFNRKKVGEQGIVYLFYLNGNGNGGSRFIWKTPSGIWKFLDPKTNKWTDTELESNSNPSEQLTPTGGMEEETGTSAVAPITTPFAFKKKVTMEDVREKDELKMAIRTLMNNDESKMTKDVARAILQRKGYSKDKIVSLENPNDLTTPLEEMTTTSGGGGSSAGTTGYNIPGAFSKKGGSEAGVEGSESLGYTLTGIGKKDMQRHADRLLAEGDEADAVYDMHSDHEADHYEKHYGSSKSKKVNTQKMKSIPPKGGTAKFKGKSIQI